MASTLYTYCAPFSQFCFAWPYIRFLISTLSCSCKCFSLYRSSITCYSRVQRVYFSRSTFSPRTMLLYGFLSLATHADASFFCPASLSQCYLFPLSEHRSTYIWTTCRTRYFPTHSGLICFALRFPLSSVWHLFSHALVPGLLQRLCFVVRRGLPCVPTDFLLFRALVRRLP